MSTAKKEESRRYMTFALFYQNYVESLKMIYNELPVIFRELFTTKTEPEEEPQAGEYMSTDDNVSDSSAVLAYGFSIIGKLYSIPLLIIPSFILDVRIGLYPTRLFKVFGHLLGWQSLIAGTLVMDSIIRFTVESSLPRLIESVYRILLVAVEASEFGHVLHAVSTNYILIRNISFIHNFTLYNFITLPKNFQRREAIKIYLITYVMSSFFVPLFIVQTIIADFNHEHSLTKLSHRQFQVLKLIMIVVVFLAAITSAVMSALVPIMTSFLIVSITQHVKTMLKKQLGRFASSLAERDEHNTDLVSMIDREAEHLIKEYGCDTVTKDWPELVVGTETIATPIVCEVLQDDEAKQIIIPKFVKRMSWFDATLKSNAHGSASSSLLFLYKNLTKSLVELRTMIDDYEERFGSFHLALILIETLTLANWFVYGFTQVRLLAAMGLQSEPYASWSLTTYMTPYFVRMIIGGVVFVVNYSILFIRCDSLEQQMRIVRCQLFKTNLDITIEALKHRPKQFSIVERKHQQNDSDDEPEITKIWSLYDLVSSMSHRVNFKLSHGTYYNKNCLLLILSRVVSILLIYIQFIDIYTVT